MFRLQSPSKSHAEARQPDMDGPEFAEVAEDSRSSGSESGSESGEEPGLANPGISKAAIPATPLRDNRRPSSQVPPKTPSFTGFKSLFGPPPKEAATPSFQGMRTMFNIEQSQPVPPTPNFTGIDEMFAPAKVAEIEQNVVKGTFLFIYSHQLFTRVYSSPRQQKTIACTVGNLECCWDHTILTEDTGIHGDSSILHYSESG